MIICRRSDPAPLPVSRSSLFLDLDGTIAPLLGSPAEARPDAARTAIVREACARLGGRVAIISGRTLEGIDALVERTCLAASGVHGLQRRTAAGEVEAAAPHPRLQQAAELVGQFAGGTAGLLVETKGQSVALHYRGAPGAEAAVVEFVTRLAEAEALEVQRGHMVAELRTPGPDKGAAVRAFMAELPFRGSTPIYLGDDLTDEPAFAEVAAQGGLGVLVARRRRPTAATARLDGPADVLAWLSESLSRGWFDFGGLDRWAA